jgi:hypothetical protein
MANVCDSVGKKTFGLVVDAGNHAPAKKHLKINGWNDHFV